MTDSTQGGGINPYSPDRNNRENRIFPDFGVPHHTNEINPASFAGETRATPQENSPSGKEVLSTGAIVKIYENGDTIGFFGSNDKLPVGIAEDEGIIVPHNFSNEELDGYIRHFKLPDGTSLKGFVYKKNPSENQSVSVKAEATVPNPESPAQGTGAFSQPKVSIEDVLKGFQGTGTPHAKSTHAESLHSQGN